MRKKLLVLSGGVTLALLAAVFAGAAAATTGAPVFYDARLTHPAPNSSGGFEVSEGEATESPTDGATGGDAVDEPIVPPEPAPPPAEPSPAPSPQPTEPTTPPSVQPPAGDTPTPTPIPDDPAAGHPAPGGPDSVDPNPDGTTPPPPPEQRRQWLAFQEIVRDCMVSAGHEYLYWEWWNPKSASSNRFPPMPADLTSDEYSAWELALYGDSGLGADYDWQKAGCWGYAVHLTGGTN
ncbi:hypothetical protein LQ757_02325 [Agromyces sp. SYSU K20354]|uniref:hypothetical protein n=1 Tax=Agromyces cavernae TaxID=2898659 RepID=UPI001E4258BF|nr:hypothetical protein [Agromyces cavernae]MCD2441103.1 hypothetical protein [Agromyces cavernae]